MTSMQDNDLVKKILQSGLIDRNALQKHFNEKKHKFPQMSLAQYLINKSILTPAQIQMLVAPINADQQKLSESFLINTDTKSMVNNQTDAQITLDDELLVEREGHKKIGRYQIIEEIGRGGMGCVYKAFDPQLQRTVALKILLGIGNEKAIKRFQIEARATAKLDHPNIVKVYDIGTEDKQPFFTMEFVEGDSLKSFIRKQSLDNNQIAQLMAKVCKAMYYAHSQGVLHRDLKPANIMMPANGEPQVMDFGLAKMTQTQEDISRTGDVLGTLQYMSPEQAQGKTKEIDKRSDVYSLGVILYELLTKQVIFEGSALNILHKIMHERPTIPRKIKPSIAVAIESICLKAISKQKQKRYRNAKSMAEDLIAFSKGQSVQAQPFNQFISILDLIKRYKKTIAMVTVAVICGYFITPTLNSVIYPTGEIEISSEIKGLRVETESKGKIDLTYTTQDRSYIYKKKLSAGNNTVFVRKEGYFPEKVSFKVTKNVRKKYRVPLQSQTVWNKKIFVDGQDNNLSLVNMNNDSHLSLIYTNKNGAIVSYDATKRHHLWSINYSLFPHYFTTQFTDLNLDGVKDIIMPQKEYMIVVNGSTRYPILEIPEFWGQSCVSIDIDNDGDKDIITFANHFPKGVRCYRSNNGKFSRKVLWQKPNIISLDNIPLVKIGTSIFFIGKNLANRNSPLGNCLIRIDTQGNFKVLQHMVGKIIDLKKISLSGRDFLVYYTANEGLSCLDLQKNQKKWVAPFKNVHGSPITIDYSDSSPRIWLHLNSVYCIDASSGKTLKTLQLKSEKDKFKNKKSSPVYLIKKDNDLFAVVWGFSYIYIIDTKVQKQAKPFWFSPYKINDLILKDVTPNNFPEIIYLANKTLRAITYKKNKYITTYLPEKYTYSIRKRYSRPYAFDFDENTKSMFCFVADLRGEIVGLKTNKNLREIIAEKKIKKETHALKIIKHKEKKHLLVITKNTIIRYNISLDEKISVYENKDYNISDNSVLVTDINNDKIQEIIFADGKNIKCIDWKGKIIWHQKKAVPSFCKSIFVKINKSKISKRVFFVDAKTVFAMDVKNGNILWEKPLATSSMGFVLSSANLIKNDKNDVPEIYCSQLQGTVSCFCADTGKLFWHTRSLGGNIAQSPVPRTKTKDLIFATDRSSVHSIDARTGKIKWSSTVSLFVPYLRGFDIAFDLKDDINQDGVDDIIVNNKENFLSVLSGKNGELLGNINEFDSLNKMPHLTDASRSTGLDFVFFNSDGQLIIIDNIIEYIKDYLAPPLEIIDNNGQHLPAIESYLHSLVHTRQFNLLSKQFYRYKNLPTHLIKFFEGALLVNQNKYIAARNKLQYCHLPRAQFLLALCHFQLENYSQATTIYADLIEKNVEKLDKYNKHYSDRIKRKHLWQKIHDDAVKKSSKNIVKIYKAFAISKINKTREQLLLRLAAKYSKDQEIHYLYEKYIFSNRNMLKSAYIQNQYIELLNQAVDASPNNLNFRLERGKVLVIYGIFYEQALKDLQMVPRKTLRGENRLYLALAAFGAKNYELYDREITTIKFDPQWKIALQYLRSGKKEQLLENMHKLNLPPVIKNICYYQK
ncbi:protein kinase [Candidatus Uabimicrobium sp. HlEnr_7]|uniref:serine/threonine-protein kinase n=1 Tax=Candidatus Uabimicrobium helgolandensis TaxID=3095367 RepID=UPI003557E7B4